MLDISELQITADGISYFQFFMYNDIYNFTFAFLYL